MNTNTDLREKLEKQNPTLQQIDAIFTDNLEYILRAAPGSGKTWTSCRRFIWRGANWPYKVGGLALLSFTNTAIKEFRNATTSVGRSDLLSDPNFAGTFDSFVERFIISPFGHLLNKSKKRLKLFQTDHPIKLKNPKLKILEQGQKGKPYPIHAWDINPAFDTITKRAVYKHKEKILNAEECRKVLSTFLSMGYYTHNHRLYWAAKLLRDNHRIAALLAKRFPEIIVDEVQDCNSWLILLLGYLRKYGSKITLVGDPDQCIYDFSTAYAGSLSELKEKWNMIEKPLSKSFRFNDAIAKSVRIIGGNDLLVGRGDGPSNNKAYFVIDDTPDYSFSVKVFKDLLSKSNIDTMSAAILCRGHDQLGMLRGTPNYSEMSGIAKSLAEAASLRDRKKDFQRAYRLVEGVIRSLIPENSIWNYIEDNPYSSDSFDVKRRIWSFMKSKDYLPTVLEQGERWVENVRFSLNELLCDLGSDTQINLNKIIQKKPSSHMQMPLFEFTGDELNIRHETIHKVKGESIDGVLVIGSAKFWNSLIQSVKNNSSPEQRRLAYVAMTRARDILLISLPKEHYKKFGAEWREYGFTELK